MWSIESTDTFDDWLDGLDEEAQVEVVALLKLLAEFGPQLRRPHADTLKGSKYVNLRELRGNTGGMVIRIAYAFDPIQVAFLLA